MAVKKVGQYLAEVRNLGVWGSLKQIRQMNLIKPGTLVGVDRVGNKCALPPMFLRRWRGGESGAGQC